MRASKSLSLRFVVKQQRQTAARQSQVSSLSHFFLPIFGFSVCFLRAIKYFTRLSIAALAKGA